MDETEDADDCRRGVGTGAEGDRRPTGFPRHRHRHRNPSTGWATNNRGGHDGGVFNGQVIARSDDTVAVEETTTGRLATSSISSWTGPG
jgi:hypothetical protein